MATTTRVDSHGEAILSLHKSWANGFFAIGFQNASDLAKMQSFQRKKKPARNGETTLHEVGSAHISIVNKKWEPLFF